MRLYIDKRDFNQNQVAAVSECVSGLVYGMISFLPLRALVSDMKQERLMALAVTFKQYLQKTCKLLCLYEQIIIFEYSTI